MRKMGVLGGTFDPIHEGHIALAKEALRHGGLDGVIFLPMAHRAHREANASADDRMNMCALAIEGYARFFLSKAGAKPEIAYTADTLTPLKKEFPSTSFTLILGADKLPSLPYWKEKEKLFSHCDFRVFPRSGVNTDEALEKARQAGAKLDLMPAFSTPYSATMIRSQTAQYQDAPGLNKKVLCYMAEHGLYQPDFTPRLKTMMSPKRFQHTLGVRKEAVRLANLHGLPIQRCALAALLHDCAKGMSLKDMGRVARENQLTDSEAVLSSGALLHAPVGAYLAKKEFHIQDEEVLNSIRSHTVGRVGMTKMEMCIFVADATEEGREDYKGLKELRWLCNRSLTAAVYRSLELTEEYVTENGRDFDPASLQTKAYLESILTDEEKALLASVR